MEWKNNQFNQYDYQKQQQTEQTFDDLMSQLQECLTADDDESFNNIYQKVKEQVLKDICINDLAVTKVLTDLQRLQAVKPRTRAIVQDFIIHNNDPYSVIGARNGVSKQYVCQLIKNLSAEIPWLDNLRRIKSELDSKNGNNINVFYPSSSTQMDLFEENEEEDPFI